MSDSKQSSVELLLDNLHLINSTKWDDVVEQAQEMHGEELADAWDYVTHNYIKGLRNQLEARDNFYNYYLETYYPKDK